MLSLVAHETAFCKHLICFCIYNLTTFYPDGTAKCPMEHYEPMPSSKPKCWYHYSIPVRSLCLTPHRSTALDLNPAGTHVLVSQVGGSARLLSIRQTDNKGSVEHSYSCKEIEARPNGFGAVFATQGQAVLFGSVEGCVLVWDKDKGAIVYGLAHEEGWWLLYSASKVTKWSFQGTSSWLWR
jgi:hypothetical protein